MQLKLSSQKYLKSWVYRVHLSYINHLLVTQLAYRRQLNIIVYNMVESDDEDPSARETGDINEATSLY